MNTSQSRHFHLHLLFGWLLAGGALTLLTPVSPDSATLGWSGLYWLLMAPGLMLLVSVLCSIGDQAGYQLRDLWASCDEDGMDARRYRKPLL